MRTRREVGSTREKEDMSTRVRTTAGTSLALCFIFAAGCGESDQVGLAVRDANHEISTLSPSGSTAAPAQLRNRVYGQVANDLDSAARAGDGDERGPAYLLAAQAKSGQAQIAHHAMRETLSEIVHLSSRVQSNIGTLLSFDAQAGAFESYDASADRAAVQQQIAALEQELAGIQSEQGALTHEIQDLSMRADSFTGKAKAIRGKAAELRNSAERLDGEARLSAITRAVELSRDAQNQDREADELAAIIENSKPQINVFERQSKKVERQLASARETQKRIDLSASQRREQARTTRANAAQSREVIGGDIERLVGILAGSFADSYAGATSAYDSALSTLGRAASSGSRDESRASKGVMEHAALVVERDAQGGLRLAERALSNAQAAGVDVPGLDELRATLAEIKLRGADLLGRARDSLDSSGVRGEAGDGLMRLSKQLSEIEREFGIEQPDADPES